MTIIVDTDTLTSLATSMTSSDCDIDIEDTTANACLTATTISTTLSSCANDRVYAEEAQRYIDSLSNDEIYLLEQMLTEKEYEFSEKNQEQLVYKKI